LNGPLTPAFQPAVDPTEVPAAKKAPVGTEGTGVRRFQQHMLRMQLAQAGGMGPGMAAPQQENHGPDRERIQHRRGQPLPAKVAVASRFPRCDGEHIVQQQHPLVRPHRQVTRCRRGPSDVLRKLLVQVAQRRRQWMSLGHGEGQPLRLTGTVVRVLAENDHPNVLRPAHRLQGREPAVGCGQAPPFRHSRVQIGRQSFRNIIRQEGPTGEGFQAGPQVHRWRSFQRHV